MHRGNIRNMDSGLLQLPMLVYLHGPLTQQWSFLICCLA